MKKIVFALLLLVSFFLFPSAASAADGDITTISPVTQLTTGGTAIGQTLSEPVNIDGDIWIAACRFNAGANTLGVVTLDISSSGTINGIVDSWAINDVVAGTPYYSVVMVDSDTCAVFGYKYVATFDVAAGGGISKSVIDNWAPANLDESIASWQVGPNIFANLERVGSTVKTISIADDGTITKAWINNVDLHVNYDSLYQPRLLNGASDIWAVYSGNTVNARIMTFEVDVTGAVTLIEGYNVHALLDGDCSAMDLAYIPNSGNIYACVSPESFAAGGDGRIDTIEIDPDGDVDPDAVGIIETYEYYTADDVNMTTCRFVNSTGMLAILQSSDESATDYILSTVRIEPDGSIGTTIDQDQIRNCGAAIHGYRVPRFWDFATDTNMLACVFGCSTTTIYSYSFEVALVPTLTCDSIALTADTIAVMDGTVTDIGSSNVTSWGFAWNTAGYPTISGSHTTTTGNLAAAPYSFQDTVSTFLPDTKYYVRAYGTNSDGTGYSANRIFYTSPDYDEIIVDLHFEPDQISGSPTRTIQDQSAYNNDFVYTLYDPGSITAWTGPLLPTGETIYTTASNYPAQGMGVVSMDFDKSIEGKAANDNVYRTITGALSDTTAVMDESHRIDIQIIGIAVWLGLMIFAWIQLSKYIRDRMILGIMTVAFTAAGYVLSDGLVHWSLIPIFAILTFWAVVSERSHSV